MQHNNHLEMLDDEYALCARIGLFGTLSVSLLRVGKSSDFGNWKVLADEVCEYGNQCEYAARIFTEYIRSDELQEFFT
jgi:hypothetical protein